MMSVIKKENINQIWDYSGQQSGGLLTVIVSLALVFGIWGELWDGGSFLFADFVEFPDVLGVQFVLLLSKLELNVGFAHFCFF